MSCLYKEDSANHHSTRVGTALDGNGIYGHNIDGGCAPTDLDACGGRTGVTPDSNGQEVYYYVITNKVKRKDGGSEARACFQCWQRVSRGCLSRHTSAPYKSHPDLCPNVPPHAHTHACTHT